LDDALEVVVVDNASKDGSAEMVKTQFPLVRLLAESTNHGYAKGNNIAFGVATGKWLITLNSDTELQPTTFQSAISNMEALKDVGCAGIRQIGLDGKVQSSIRGFPTLIGIFGDITGIGQLFPNSIFDSYRKVGFDYAKSGPAEQPMGTFLIFRASALEAIGARTRPFDENFPIFFNEVDLLKRLDLTGWKTWYFSDAALLHHGGESTRQVRKSMIWESHKSLMRYLWKHHKSSPVALILPLVGFIVYIAAFVRAKGYHAGFSS